MADDLTTGQTVDVMIRVTAPNAQAAGQQVTQSIRQVTAAAKEGGNALPSFYEGVEQAGYKAGGAERGIRRMEFALSSVAAAALFSKNANETLADSMLRVGEAALLFAGGSPTALAFGGGLATFAVTLRAIQGPYKAIAEANDRLAASFGQLTEKIHPGVGAMREVVAVSQQLAQVHEEAQPTFVQQLLGTGVLGLLGPLNGVRDQIEAQKILANAADATAESLRPVLSELVAIGQTKDLITNVTAAMRGISAVGVTRTLPGMDFGVVGGQYQFAPTRTGTGLVGALNDAINKLPGNLTTAERAQAIQQLAQLFSGESGKSIRAAGANLTDTPEKLGEMARQAVDAIRGTGLPKKIADELIDQVKDSLLVAIRDYQNAFGTTTPLGISARVRGTIVGRGGRISLAPFPLFGARGFRPFDESGNLIPDFMHGSVNLSSVGDVGARNAAERDAANRDIKINKAADTFGLALTASVGRAITAVAGRGGGVGGLFTGASDILSTFASQRDATSGELLHPGLALPATILSVAGGLFSGILSNLFSSGISIKDYGPQALAQLRSVMVAGGIMSFNVTNSGGRSVPDIQNQIARNQSRDSIPRFPQQPPGAGR